MSGKTRVFVLPDLGEGLQDAEVREWLVKVGDTVRADQPLLSVETAKAIVEVPSPRDGTIAALHAQAGDVVPVGQALLSFSDGDEAAPPPEPAAPIRDSGVVVGSMAQGNEVLTQQATRISHGAGTRVMPAVRALAQRLNVDLAIVTPSGPNETITAADVQRVHQILTSVGPLEKLRGPRRAMAATMSQARDEVMATTLSDDAVLHGWAPAQDVTLRLIRALVAACKAQPALNAWYDGAEVGRRLLEKIHLGIAVDTADGLYVAVLQDVENRSAESLRAGLQRMKADAAARAMQPDDLRGYTITLSNFGKFGGKYATPVIVPPTVAIVAAGAIRDAVVPLQGQIAIAPVLPLSVSFDHRAVTGGEAARFLAAMIADLQQPQ